MKLPEIRRCQCFSHFFETTENLFLVDMESCRKFADFVEFFSAEHVKPHPFFLRGMYIMDSFHKSCIAKYTAFHKISRSFGETIDISRKTW